MPGYSWFYETQSLKDVQNWESFSTPLQLRYIKETNAMKSFLPAFLPIKFLSSLKVILEKFESDLWVLWEALIFYLALGSYQDLLKPIEDILWVSTSLDVLMQNFQINFIAINLKCYPTSIVYKLSFAQGGHSIPRPC